MRGGELNEALAGWRGQVSPVVLQQTFLGIVGILESRDAEGRGHAARVTSYASQLARVVGFVESEIPTFRFATLVHDIGKLAISEAILNKPGPLSPQEYRAVQAHPLIGARLLQPLFQELEPRVLDVVLSHHERYDGRGYPHGLSGEAIPLWARVCSIADAWDVMTSPRVYRPPLAFEEAVSELRRCSGTQFDPELTALFINKVLPGLALLPATDRQTG